jgi:hypothetical protein
VRVVLEAGGALAAALRHLAALAHATPGLLHLWLLLFFLLQLVTLLVVAELQKYS